MRGSGDLPHDHGISFWGIGGRVSGVQKGVWGCGVQQLACRLLLTYASEDPRRQGGFVGVRGFQNVLGTKHNWFWMWLLQHTKVSMHNRHPALQKLR